MFHSKFEKIENTKIEYFTYHSNNPGNILITSGVHGNENSIIQPLHSYLSATLLQLPSFTFIPKMSPSAVALNARKNAQGHDLNRMFGMNEDDAERDVLAKIIHNSAPYDLVVSFHEDMEDSDTYFYETGMHSDKLQLEAWRREIKAAGLTLLNGVDDPNDPAIGYVFTNGYNYEAHAVNSGALEHWVILENLTKRCLTLEIPGSATTLQKQKEIDIIFSHLILPEFEKEPTE